MPICIAFYSVTSETAIVILVLSDGRHTRDLDRNRQ